MPKIAPFEVEEWMFRYQNTPGCINISETCAASISLDDLQALSSSDGAAAPPPLSTRRKLVYGDILGSDVLCRRIAALCSRGAAADDPLPAEGVLVTQGAISANFLLLYALVGPGDHVVCVYPTYQQLYEVPKSLGAKVSLWKLKEENEFVPDPAELEGLVRDNTKLIILNNPNNPTGAVIPAPVLRSIVDFARARDITILSDEVYAPLFHGLPAGAEAPPSILSLGYARTVVTGSMSKAWSLAGIRVGWIASRDPSVLRAAASARDYAVISVSQLDDQVAAYALSDAVRPGLAARNDALARANCALLAEFVRRHGAVCWWVPPRAGTTAFVRFSRRATGEPVDDAAFCVDALDKAGVMMVPGSKCFGQETDFRGFVRIGYVCETEVLRRGLEALGRYVEENL